MFSIVYNIACSTGRNTGVTLHHKKCLCKPVIVVAQIFTGTSVAMGNSPIHRLVVYDSRPLSMVCCTGGGT